MKEIREAFHTISNHLNNISVQAGAKSVLARQENIDTMDEAALKDELENAIETLSTVETSALKAGETLIELKKKVYTMLKMDTTEPHSSAS